MIWKIWKKDKLKCEKIWKIWKKDKLKCEKILSTIHLTFLAYFPYHFTIRLIFLPYFPYLFTIQLPKSTGKWIVLLRHLLEKQVTLHFKRCGLKKYGKMKCFITSCTRKVGGIVKWYGKYRRKVSRLVIHIFPIFSLFNLHFFCIF
jgi:hypothetical protein